MKYLVLFLVLWGVSFQFIYAGKLSELQSIMGGFLVAILIMIPLTMLFVLFGIF